MASTRGISATSGINERATIDAVEKEHTGDRDDATTSDKMQLVSRKSLDLNLKMASRSSCSTSDHVQDANIGSNIMIGRPSGSEVGDRAVSYESQGPNARKRKLEDVGITAARPHLGMQQADSAETTKIDCEYNEIITGQQFSAGPSKCSRDTNLSGTFQFPFRKSSGGAPCNLLDDQIEAGTNIVNQFNTERDHVIGNISTRDSTHTSSIVAMDTVYHSSDDESFECVENIPVSDNAVHFPSVDLNETSELNNSYQVQESGCFQPHLEIAGRETGVSSSNACGEVLNTEILSAHARDGPSFGISGGSIGFVPEKMSREDNQGDSEAVVSQCTPRTISGSKPIVSTKVEFGEGGEKPSGSMQMPSYENGAHPSLSCNAVLCSAYEISKEEVTQTRKGSHNDDGAWHESGYLSADVVGTPYRDNTNGGVEFNPIKLHNDYCPWVNGNVAAAGSDSPFSSSGADTVALCGWQLTLDAVDSFQSLGYLPVQTLESESAASMCKGDQLNSTQKLLAHNSYAGGGHGRN